MKRLFLLLSILLLVAFPVMAQDGPTLTIFADETRSEPLRDIGAQFEEEQGIAVNVVEFPFDDIREQFTTTAPSGEGPDIIVGANDWVGELVVNGLLLPLDLSAIEADFSEAAIGAFNFDGDVYGLPFAVENVALYYNADLVPEPPATWEDVRAISETLVADGASQYGWVIQQNDPYHSYGLVTAFGGAVFEFSAETGYNPENLLLDSQATIDAYEFLQSYTQDGLMPAGLDSDGMRALFEAGDAAMVISGPWDLARFQDALGDNLGIAPIPSQVAEGAPFIGVQGFMVSALSEQQQLASLFVTNYIATADVQQQLFETGGRPPAYLPLADTIEDPNLQAFSAAGANGFSIPAYPFMSGVFNAWANAIELTVQDQLTAEEALTTAAETIRADVLSD